MARARAQLCHSSGRRRLAAAAAPRTAQAPSGSPAPQGPRLPRCGRVPGATVTGTPALRGPVGAAHLEDVLAGQTENATPLRNHAQAAGTPTTLFTPAAQGAATRRPRASGAALCRLRVTTRSAFPMSHQPVEWVQRQLARALEAGCDGGRPTGRGWRRDPDNRAQAPRSLQMAGSHRDRSMRPRVSLPPDLRFLGCPLPPNLHVLR